LSTVLAATFESLVLAVTPEAPGVTSTGVVIGVAVGVGVIDGVSVGVGVAVGVGVGLGVLVRVNVIVSADSV
jgi:hypothetical protein